MLALAATAGAGSLASGGSTSCTSGMSTINGKNARTFCGSAKTIVHVGAKTYTIKGGLCSSTPKSLSVNIGTVVLLTTKQALPYFGLDIGQYEGANPGTPAAPGDGTFLRGLVTVRVPGGSWDLNGAGDPGVKVTLTGNRTKGTFTGNTFFSPHTRVTGSFSC